METPSLRKWHNVFSCIRYACFRVYPHELLSNSFARSNYIPPWYIYSPTMVSMFIAKVTKKIRTQSEGRHPRCLKVGWLVQEIPNYSNSVYGGIGELWMPAISLKRRDGGGLVYKFHVLISILEGMSKMLMDLAGGSWIKPRDCVIACDVIISRHAEQRDTYCSF